MTKKILILSTSPRPKGNSDSLCDQFLLGAQEAGHEVEKIRTAEKKINYCKGCGTCYNSQKCHQKDDMAEILEKMIAADVIVMATPVYFYAMSGQMKTLIDRTVARYTEIINKNFYLLIAAADSNKQAIERTVDGFRGFLNCLDNADEKGIVYGLGAWQLGDIKNNPAMREAYEMGKSI